MQFRRSLPSLHGACVRAALALSIALLPAAGMAVVPRAPEVIHIPLAGTAAQAAPAMVAGVFAPPGEGPFPVVVYSHGRSADRGSTGLPDPRGFVRYWVRKGFAVVAPIRPGYGATGGRDREDSGVLYDIFGNCWGHPRFGPAAEAARDALVATIGWLRAQSWADAHRIVLVGTSMGGLASIATAAAHIDGVVGYVNFAGGTGGNGEASPAHSCGAEDMEALLAQYGAATRVPSLWLYAENDAFWGRERPRLWYRAFAAGGSAARFVETAPVPGADGHQLLARGSRLWMPEVDRFLAELGF
jgi:dienelactone hydrolase